MHRQRSSRRGAFARPKGVKRKLVARGLPAGLLVTAALPPFGWWPLAIVGVAYLASQLEVLPRRERLPLALGFGLGLLLPGLWWMTEFSLPGFVLAMFLESLIVAVFIALPPAGRWQVLGLPAAFVLLDAFRGRWPFGGVPIATLGATQVGGPLMQVARVGGALLVGGVLAVAGVALLAVVRRRWRRAGVGIALVVAVTLAGFHAPDGERSRSIRAAVVQGGGERGNRAIHSDESKVFDAHVAATAEVPDGVDLILWPEDVVDVEDDVLRTHEGVTLSSLASMHRATIVAGVVTSDDDSFQNVAQVWGPDGLPGDIYEKNQRVPFGEYIPFRGLVEKVADVSAVPADAEIGEGPGILRTDAGRLGVVISFEVFFARRARAAMKAGGTVLLVPTNASSYPSTQMPALELAEARLRAVETGKEVLQAAPTGFSGIVDERGTVRAVTHLGRRQVVTATVDHRTGETPYTRLGDGPFVVGALLALLASWWFARRARR
jgi:apolipoprotein N-acyltransferase